MENLNTAANPQLSEYAEQRKKEYAKDVARVIDDCRFASVVSTSTGDALLIGSTVVHIVADRRWLYAEAIAKALRSVDGMRTSGDGSHSHSIGGLAGAGVVGKIGQ